MNTGSEPPVPAEPPTPPPGPVRDGRGHFIRTLDHAARDARAAELRSTGMSYRAIGAELGLNKGDAWRAVQRALTAVMKEPAEKLIAVEAAKLDELYVEALEVLDREHYAHSNGRLILVDGEPALDDGPRLAAIRELRQIRESYRKLHGLDAEQKVNVSGAVRYEVVGVDPADLS
ncbi:hypothetical protein [Streptomyces sp. NPDC055006]